MFNNAEQLRATTPQAFENGAFDQFTGRPINYKQTLWVVRDADHDYPEDRFVAESSPLVESVIESNTGPIEDAPIAAGLLEFVNRFVKLFGAVPTEFSTSEAVIDSAKPFFDYIEPYFLFVDMPVQVSGNQMVKTYRYKKGGSVLDPSRVEVFRVVPEWTFQPYTDVCKFLDDPRTLDVLRGVEVLNSNNGKPVTKEDLLDRIVNTIWGTPRHLMVHVEDWLFRHYTDLQVSNPRFGNDDELLRSVDSYQQRDQYFWNVAAVATFLWFRSPHALPFLIDYHPIYGSVLQVNPRSEKIEVIEKSGGEAIVYQWDVYTHEHLVVEQNRLPGTCECCQGAMHCTKFVNATALFHPICSCGQPVDVEDVGEGRYRHAFSSRCDPYRKEHPAFEAFACQRCLQMAIRDPHNQARKCERFECPATECKHHAGKQAYVHALSQRRRLMLTEMRH